MWSILKHFFLTLGRWELEREYENSSYTPNPNGHWVNKGTVYDEKWRWFEPETEKLLLYITVANESGGYAIIISEELPDEGLEYVDCDDKRDVEIVVCLLSVKYGTLGSVRISDQVGLGISEYKL